MIALAAVLTAAGAAMAGPDGAGADSWPQQAAPPGDNGKPMVFVPMPDPAPDPSHCLPALPCGTRLYGAVQKDGAVEVQVPALRW